MTIHARYVRLAHNTANDTMEITTTADGITWSWVMDVKVSALNNAETKVFAQAAIDGEINKLVANGYSRWN